MNQRVKILNPTKIDPELVIESIRESFVGSEQVYTMGSCYKLSKILCTIFPSASSWCYKKKSHVLTKIDGIFYDIFGEVEADEKVLFKINNPGDIESWIFNIYDVHVECPNCEELFFRAEIEDEITIHSVEGTDDIINSVVNSLTE